MNKYYIKGCFNRGSGSYIPHDFKVMKLKKSRLKTAKASKRANRK